jgi:hypothetical protein
MRSTRLAMTLGAKTSVSAESQVVVEIRRSVAFYLLLATLVAVGVFFVVDGRMHQPGGLFTFEPFHRRDLLALGLLPLLIWWVIDRRPVLVLNANGIRDRRLSFDVLPWSEITRAEVLSYSRPLKTYSGVRLHFRRHMMMVTYLRAVWESEAFVSLEGLDVHPLQMVEYLTRFAPHVSVDTTLLEIK